jgi:hypothetical protein
VRLVEHERARLEPCERVEVGIGDLVVEDHDLGAVGPVLGPGAS